MGDRWVRYKAEFFDEKEDAEKSAAAFRERYYGYDGKADVSWAEEKKQWRVDYRRWHSCD